MPRSPPRRRSPRRWGPVTLPLWDMWHPPRVAPPGRPSAAVPAIERVSTCTRRYPSGAWPRYGPMVRPRLAALEARVASSPRGTRIRLRNTHTMNGWCSWAPVQFGAGCCLTLHLQPDRMATVHLALDRVSGDPTVE